MIGALQSMSAVSLKEIKKYVAIVRPEISENQKNFSTEMAIALSNKGFYSASNSLKPYSRGWFGSGFLVQDENGKTYILTNKHVTNGVKNTSIEFNIDGHAITYAGCRVVAECEEVDLALVELPQQVKVDRFIPFSTQPIKEGDEVWSAGYPGLGSTPVWQLGKGIISNTQVKDKEFGEDVSVIQHTAQVDHGNSGGPLLVVTQENDEKIVSVVGVNTWKAGGRENTNFAIPSQYAKLFMAGTRTKNSEETPLESVVNDFTQGVKYDFKKLTNYISDDYVYSVKKEEFNKLYSDASEEAMKWVVENLKEKKISDAVRILLADCIAQNVKKEKESFTFQTSTINGDSAEVNFVYKGKVKKSTWVKEEDGWKITTYGMENKSHGNKSYVSSSHTGVHIIKKKYHELYLGSNFGLSEYAGINFELGYAKYYIPYLYNNFFLMGGTDKYPYKDDEYKDCTSGHQGMGGLGIGVGGIVPIGIDTYTISPFIQPGFLFNMLSQSEQKYGGIDSSFLFELRTGVRFGWRYDSNHQIFVSTEFVHEHQFLGIDTDKLNREYIGLTVGWDF